MNEQRRTSETGRERTIDRSLGAAIVRLLCEIHDAIGREARQDFPHPDRMLSECSKDREQGRFETYLAELLDRFGTSQVLLHGDAVRIWSERKHRLLDPNRFLLSTRGLLATTRKARAFDLLRPVIAELRPEIVQQEIDSEFRTLRGRTRSLNRRNRPPTVFDVS